MYLAVHVVDLCALCIGAVLAHREIIAVVIDLPRDPLPDHCGPSIVVVGFRKKGVEQRVAAAQVAFLHIQKYRFNYKYFPCLSKSHQD